ncbi:MAG TPA: ferritin-like domain-containing protein [Vulgatibacter sp.]
MAEQTETPFLTDIQTIRKRARDKMHCGPIMPSYEGDLQLTLKLLNEALATELVCTLRYRHHFIAAQGINSEGAREEFLEHAQDELEHAMEIAERIDQLGGNPEFNPGGLLTLSASEYVEGDNLVAMLQEDLVAERIAVQTYQEMIRYFAEKDPTTRRLLERILAKEEEHASDMHDLLVRHEGKPMLDS